MSSVRRMGLWDCWAATCCSTCSMPIDYSVLLFWLGVSHRLFQVPVRNSGVGRAAV